MNTRHEINHTHTYAHIETLSHIMNRKLVIHHTHTAYKTILIANCEMEFTLVSSVSVTSDDNVATSESVRVGTFRALC